MKRFEIYWTQLDPAVGTEIQKTRPCVIISPDAMNDSRINRVIVAPLTSRLREYYPYRLRVEIADQTSDILLDQIRAVDKTRLGKKLGRLAAAEQAELIHLLSSMFAA
jgi:mRNA interferase MazF